MLFRSQKELKNLRKDAVKILVAGGQITAEQIQAYIDGYSHYTKSTSGNRGGYTRGKQMSSLKLFTKHRTKSSIAPVAKTKTVLKAQSVKTPPAVTLADIRAQIKEAQRELDKAYQLLETFANK